jgi:hypothetical protein|tara:strand:- start:6363 stop:6500 length:138 start_codon:yes stop_codon:yes gene_type:complete
MKDHERESVEQVLMRLFVDLEAGIGYDDLLAEAINDIYDALEVQV